MPLQLYARCDLRATSTRKGVMPVPRHWHPGSFFLDSSVACWNDNKEHVNNGYARSLLFILNQL